MVKVATPAGLGCHALNGAVRDCSVYALLEALSTGFRFVGETAMAHATVRASLKGFLGHPCSCVAGAGPTSRGALQRYEAGL